MYNLKTLILITFLFTAFQLHAQQKTIRGSVTDSNGETLPGVSVLVKGSNVGTNTDTEGNFQIMTEGDVTLIFSLMGFTDVEAQTQGKTRVEVTLFEESTDLDEVVVMGYNTVERKHLASSISEIDMDKIKSRPIFKMEEAFSGTVPGATILQGSNLPGSGPGAVSIRGISTLQNASPLVIVDGMEQSLSDLDPNQI